jgi:ribonuclease P/MRP protein subunit RPP1|tara:strand:- start:620 stop:1072 length:453 start_codon:yes stop_codon:yes gene_type:complete
MGKIISTTQVENAKQLIKKSTDKIVIVQAQDDAFNRKILEYGKFQILLSPEAGNRRNKLRQIDSGLNHVLTKIAAKNKVAIGIDFKDIRKLDKNAKANRLSRIAQNIKILRKSNTMIAVLNSTSKETSRSFLLSLGASTKQTKKAVMFFN